MFTLGTLAQLALRLGHLSCLIQLGSASMFYPTHPRRLLHLHRRHSIAARCLSFELLECILVDATADVGEPWVHAGVAFVLQVRCRCVVAPENVRMCVCQAREIVPARCFFV